MSSEASFDHCWQLNELLDATELARIGTDLAALLGAALAIEDVQGRVLWGEAQGPEIRRQPLILELDPIAYLASPAEAEKLTHAAALFQFMLRTRLRFHMAASLHQESTEADYAELRRSHAHVLESEARYRKLAGELETRVHEQVAELELRQQQLFQSARLATVGQLAAGVAHEMNTPLGFINSNLGTLDAYLKRFTELATPGAIAPALRQKLDLDFTLEDAGLILTECREGLTRIARIVQELKTFSSIDLGEQARCDINACLQHAADLIDGSLPPDITLQLDLAPDLPAIPGVVGHLNQAFLNLLQNAAQAITDSGHPGTISVSSQLCPEHIEVRIHDDGIGMNPEVLQKAFDPFFTTRPVGSGTGLGLSSVRTIMLAHGGHTDLLSAPGDGCTALIRLPLP